MSLEAWWPSLRPETRDWVIANNGDAVPDWIIEEITRVGGPVTSEAWWVGENGPAGFYLSDAATDWIEAVANGETPKQPVTSRRPSVPDTRRPRLSRYGRSRHG